MESTKKSLLYKVVLVCAGILAALLIIEGATRLASGVFEKNSRHPIRISLFDFGNILAEKLVAMGEKYPTQHDPVLGWVPKADYVSADNILQKKISIRRDTTRVSSSLDKLFGPAILAVGDSFTFGDSVNNNETWPARLEELLARPVVNGGVPGYSLDQAFLRARSMAGEISPGVILLGLTPEGMPGMGFSMWGGAAKPYFDVDNGLLVLRNQPVPDQGIQVEDLGLLKGVLGHFYLADCLMRATGNSGWWYADKYKRVAAANDMNGVETLLIEAFYNLTVLKGSRGALVVQYAMDDILDPARVNRKRIYPTIVKAREKGIVVVDFYPLLKAMPTGELNEYFNGLMTVKGNLFTAKMIAAALASEGVIPNASYLSADVMYFRQAVGQNMDELDRLAMAKDNFLRELANDPQNPSKYNTVGVLYLNIGALDSAAFYFARAMKLDPNYAEAINNMGMVAMTIRRFGEAEQYFRKAMALDQKMFEAFYNMACARSLQKDREGAVDWLEKAIASGFSNRSQLEHDGDLEYARKSKRFGKLLEALPAK